jgi:hypothetical protein
MGDWYDIHHGAYARNLNRVLAGQTFEIETGDTVTIERVKEIAVGLDSYGIFAAVTIIDTEGGEWSLGSNGSISTAIGHVVGEHGLTTKPAGVL